MLDYTHVVKDIIVSFQKLFCTPKLSFFFLVALIKVCCPTVTSFYSYYFFVHWNIDSGPFAKQKTE